MISYFTRHATAANLLMLTLLVAGILLVQDVKRESLPDITPSEVEIKIIYPGASAAEIEEAIVQSVEDAIDGVRFVEEVRSEAKEGVAIVIIKMTEGGDFPAFKDEIESEVNAIDNFPDGTELPIFSQLGTKDQVLAILISGDMTAANIKAYNYSLKDKLQQLPGISLVDVQGFSERQFRVELSTQALMQYGLSTLDVVNAIKLQSINSPVGGIETAEQEILLRFVEQRRSTEALGELVIAGKQGGAEVLLRDLANISDTFEFNEDKILQNGQRAGKIKISKTKTEDSLLIADKVRAFIEKEKQLQPNVSFYITEDDSQGLRDRLAIVVTNGIQGMILVFLLLWMFFPRKLAFWVVMGLPVSFLGAAAFMPVFGLTINLMTLVGFLLALGILMDDAIVIAENIVTHRQQGKSHTQAAIDGVMEVKNGVFSSFVTTVCILGPLSLIDGDIGKLLKVVPLILILVLAVSLIEAFMILPAHLSHSLQDYDENENSKNRFRKWFEKKFDYMREHYVGRAVDKAIANRYLFLGSAVGLLLLSGGIIISGVLSFQALPKLEGNVLVARVLLPQGTPLQRTEAVIQQLQNGLEQMNEKFSPEQPNERSLVRGSYVQFNLNTDAFESGPHVATITADLLTAEERNGRIEDYINGWRDATGAIPDVISITISEPSVNPAGRDIDIRLKGKDLALLKQAAIEMRQWFEKFEGVFNISDDLRLGKKEFLLTVKDGTFASGLDARNISQQLSAAFQGTKAGELQIGNDTITVDVRLRQSLQDSLDDLDYFHVKTTNGSQIPLKSAVNATEAQGWARIAHVDGLRTISLRGDVDTAVANSSQLIGQLRKDFLPEFYQRYPSIQVAFEGQEKNAKTTQRSIIIGTLLGLIGVFILLSFQFRNYFEPLVVMSIIPFSIIGVVTGHLLMGMPFTLPSLLGFISLAGIVVNDSLLLVLFIKKGLKEGQDIFQAASQASRARFRAIFLTSTSTIAGLMPLLAESSLQAQIIQPLAVSIAFGLLATTVLVLFVIPCVYAVLADFKLIEKLVVE